MKRILIIGGYGNFGSFISRQLAQNKNIRVIVAGRTLEKAQKMASTIGAEAVCVDINNDFMESLADIKPDIVIHTSGPFQAQGYDVAQSCINQGCHYIDLADGREFVENIKSLDKQAKKKGVFVVSGASSVPCLTSALVDHYRQDFKTIDSLDYGITTAQKTARGLATTAAILSYTGKPFPTLINGLFKNIYGWQSLKARKYPSLGWRLLGNCDVPDLALFPKRYPELKNIRFYAGLEIPLIHVTLWALSWLVRFKLIKRLEKYAPIMLKASYMFDWLGSVNSAFHMELSGEGKDGENKTITFELTAGSGDGPYIPCMPSIILATKLANDDIKDLGAFPCVAFISKDEYLNNLKDLDIEWTENIYH